MYISKIGQLGKDELQELFDTCDSYGQVLESIGLNPHGNNRETLNNYINEFDIDLTKFNINKANATKLHFNSFKPRYSLDEIISKPGIPYPSNKLKQKLIQAGYKENKCEICGITEWMGKPISLQLHHNDGDRNNNQLSNLRILCPNCHSQTDTFAGKNIKYDSVKKERKRPTSQDDIIKPTRDELKRDIRILGFKYVRNKYHVGDNKLRQWCEEYGLPKYKDDIYAISDEDWINI